MWDHVIGNEGDGFYVSGVAASLALGLREAGFNSVLLLGPRPQRVFLSQAAPDLLTHFLTQEIELTPRPGPRIPQAHTQLSIRPSQSTHTKLASASTESKIEISIREECPPVDHLNVLSGKSFNFAAV